LINCYSMLLELSGFTVRHASNGAEALRMIVDSAPDVVVTDWMMPIMDGRAPCEELRKPAGPYASIPIIVASAVMEPPEGAQRLYDSFLRKPLTISDLLRQLDEVLAAGRVAS
jgi:CheY-like chemotaxis protein